MNIAVFFGSRSCEHDVSIVSALQCIEATKAAGFNVTPVYISRDGLWYTGEPLENIETFREFNPMTKGITRVTLDVTANAGDLWAWPPQRAGLFAKVPAPLCHIDCVIPVFHGWHGEDGTIQGLLEMANIPYASSGVLGSAIGMDKIAMKQILRGAGFPVMPSWDGNSDTWPVTSRMSTQQTVLMPQPGQDIYSTNQMSWPQREKTMAFNQALNSWLDDVRANRDDWCTIVHSDIEATRLSLKTCLGQLS